MKASTIIATSTAATIAVGAAIALHQKSQRSSADAKSEQARPLTLTAWSTLQLPQSSRPSALQASSGALGNPKI